MREKISWTRSNPVVSRRNNKCKKFKAKIVLQTVSGWSFRCSTRQKAAGGRWVYALKTDIDGSEKHKARFVAKGYSQNPESDSEENSRVTSQSYMQQPEGCEIKLEAEEKLVCKVKSPSMV